MLKDGMTFNKSTTVATYEKPASRSVVFTWSCQVLPLKTKVGGPPEFPLTITCSEVGAKDGLSREISSSGLIVGLVVSVMKGPCWQSCGSPLVAVNLKGIDDPAVLVKAWPCAGDWKPQLRACA